MSSLLTLAKDLEQKSKVQQQSTGEMLKVAFSEHEQSVKAELNASAKRISDAISAHDQTMTATIASNTKGLLKTVGRTWLTIAMTSVLLIAMSGSVLWWLGQQIVSNRKALSQQEDALTKLTAKTWGVRYQTGEDGRRFLVIPSGTKPEIIPYDGTIWIQLKQE